jgi:truncated hemoglobin YjbI
MNNTELTFEQLSQFAGGQSLAQSSQGGIYQAKMLAEMAIETAAASAVTGAMQTAATGAMQTAASTAATGPAAARVAASAPTGAM